MLSGPLIHCTDSANNKKLTQEEGGNQVKKASKNLMSTTDGEGAGFSLLRAADIPRRIQ